MGLVQNDLKRIIAYSTCSQLGYMVTACGASNYSVGIFHLFNHAFLKHYFSLVRSYDPCFSK
jgi:NADH-ubiquinone oxidoreductase chain 5